ncbi:MAG: PQQ-binding-like beta-propeller repeat protein [Phycisphaerae bacterium]|nr:PQQ-binding-like beta-propeller repeat protein [Tepidisphaeraceae bacterium]
MLKKLATLLLGAALYAAPALADDNWPQFRGPTGQGLTDSQNLPTTWAEDKNVKWKAPIKGRGWSSPVVWGNQVWITTADDAGRDLFVLCFDKETGKVVHDVKLFTDPAPNPIFRKFNTYASPTPVIEEGRIYVTFGAAGTACLDTKSASVIWERTDIKINHYRGAGSSLFEHQGLLYLNFDGSDAQFIVALDKQTGKDVWRVARSVDYADLDATGKPKAEGDLRKAFSTCRLAPVNGQPAIISVGAKATYAYEPKTGKEIWRLDHKDWHSAGAVPVIGDGLIYVAPGYSKAGLLAIKADGTGALPPSGIAWKAPAANAPNKPSPLLHDGLLYTISDGGFATCWDAKTGAEIWKQRLADNFSAAPIAGDGKIYFFGEKGNTFVMALGREPKLLATNKLAEGCMATTAVSGKALFVRTTVKEGGALYRIQE